MRAIQRTRSGYESLVFDLVSVIYGISTGIRYIAISGGMRATYFENLRTCACRPLLSEAKIGTKTAPWWSTTFIFSRLHFQAETTSGGRRRKQLERHIFPPYVKAFKALGILVSLVGLCLYVIPLVTTYLEFMWITYKSEQNKRNLDIDRSFGNGATVHVDSIEGNM